MTTHSHAAHDCQWAMQTIDLPLPDWLDAWDTPWTCRRDPRPRRLLSTDDCVTCQRWEVRTAGCAAAPCCAAVESRAR